MIAKNQQVKLQALFFFGKHPVKTKAAHAYYGRPGNDQKYPARQVHFSSPRALALFQDDRTISARARKTARSPILVHRM